MKLEVGQKLWYVPGELRDRQREITIDRVGKKWAYYNRNGRIDINTLQVDGGKYSSPGKCYLSKEEYDNYLTILISWRNFSREIPMRNLPKGMTQEKIDLIRKLVFGGDDEKISE